MSTTSANQLDRGGRVAEVTSGTNPKPLLHDRVETSDAQNGHEASFRVLALLT